MFLNALILQAVYLYFLIRFLNVRERIADRLAKVFLFSIVLIVIPAPVVRIAGAVLFSLSIFYFFLTTKKLGAASKFVILSGFFCLITFVGLKRVGLGAPIVKLHFFNLLISIPFELFAKLPLFRSRVFADVAESFISNTALFWHGWAAPIGIVLCVCCAHVMMQLLNRYAPRSTQPPDIGRIRLPFTAAFIALAAAVCMRFVSFEGSVAPSYLISIVKALFILNGICMLTDAARGLRIPAGYVFLIFFMALFIREIMWLIVAAGAADGLFGLRLLFDGRAGDDVRRREGRPMLKPAVFSFAGLVVVVAAVLIVAGKSGTGRAASGFAAPHAKMLYDELKYEHEKRGSEIYIAGPEKAFYIDVYEYPNVKDRRPVTKVSTAKARSLCEATGKRLCGADEWATACMSGSEKSKYYMADDPYKAEALFRKKCAMATEQVVGSGEFAGCRNGFGVHDMAGNVWEIVDVGRVDVLGIMGQGEETGCKECNRCDWVLYYYPEQKKEIDMRDVGFRCCRDGERRSSGNE